MHDTSADRPQAILYAAKSTQDEHASIPNQLADCRAMAEREGWEIVGEYQDEGFSAYSGNRGPGLEAAREHVTRISGVLVAQHSDRVARGAGDHPDAADHLVEVVVSLRRAGAQLHTCQDDFFADPRIGLVMASLMGQRNTEDSARKSAATKAGKRRAWERGEFPGGTVPDGFELVRDGEERVLRLDPKRIDVIRLIGELADQGWGDASIARELNRRGHRTKGGGAWTRRRVQDLLSNPRYYGGSPWRRGAEDEEINWNTSYPAPWSREDFERRRRGVRDRDLAKGSNRRPGRPHVNHALAGLAYCGGCMEKMKPRTSHYRRKDGSRRRTYQCQHVHQGTGQCHAPALDAELIDAYVINGLQHYLGDFEAWRDQLTSGYASERQRLEREVDSARADMAEQEKICERHEMAIGIAENAMEIKVATQAAARAQERLTRCQTRLEAAQHALHELPTAAPADAMLDFYNELSAAVRGRLDGASTLARVNDALKDIFFSFILDAPGTHPDGDGVRVTPVLAETPACFSEPWWDGVIAYSEGSVTPPLKRFHVPWSKSVDALT